MKEMVKYMIGMDYDCWSIDFPVFCKRIHDEIPDANGLEVSFEHPDLFKLFPSKKLVDYINDVISSYNFNCLSMHSPTKDINISSYNPRIRETSYRELVKSLDLLSQLNAPEISYFLVHGGQNSFRTPSSFGQRNLHASISNHIENLIELNKLCEEYGIPLTIENLIRSLWRLSSKIEYLDALFKEIPNTKLAFDIDHAVFVSYSYAKKMLSNYNKRINVVHVGNINNFHKLKNRILQIDPYFVFEPHSIKYKTQLFRYLNKNVKTVKNLKDNYKNQEIIVSE